MSFVDECCVNKIFIQDIIMNISIFIVCYSREGRKIWISSSCIYWREFIEIHLNINFFFFNKNYKKLMLYREKSIKSQCENFSKVVIELITAIKCLQVWDLFLYGFFFLLFSCIPKLIQPRFLCIESCCVGAQISW